MLRSARLLSLALLLIASPVLAQYSIKSIEIHGAAPYTDAEVLTVSGLQSGQMMTRNSLASAAQHLLDTGVFADAQISLEPGGLTRTVLIELRPLPSSSLAPATFANLVWWTPSELDAALRKAVPFYRGGIPPAGNLSDSINAALTAMLATKGIHGTVSNTPVQPTNAHPQLTWNFRLDDPSVRVGALHLHGSIPSAVIPALQRAVNHAAGSPYNESPSGLEDLLLFPLRDAGYINAQLTGISRQPAQSASGYTVDYTATIVPGDAFHVTAIAFQPTSIYTQDAFTHDAALHNGDVASELALFKTEQAIVNAYLHLGYLDAYVDAHPQQDASAHTVTYSLSVVPGEIYHIHTVNTLNLSPDAQKDFDTAWLLKPGTVYDPLYTAHFLTNNTAMRHLAGYTAGFQAAADPQTHLVDLTINFVPTGGQ